MAGRSDCSFSSNDIRTKGSEGSEDVSRLKTVSVLYTLLIYLDSTTGITQRDMHGTILTVVKRIFQYVVDVNCP